jgi:hypothetical protein
MDRREATDLVGDGQKDEASSTLTLKEVRESVVERPATGVLRSRQGCNLLDTRRMKGHRWSAPKLHV